MKHLLSLCAAILLSLVLLAFHSHDLRWGFFGHRRINRLAVFTLAPEMMPLFKANIEFLTDHAVDPDKRRYALKDEAPRHFIDLDRWEHPGEDGLPHQYLDALILHGNLYFEANGERQALVDSKNIFQWNKIKCLGILNKNIIDTNFIIPYHQYKYFIASKIFPALRNSDDVVFRGESINTFFNKPIADTGMDYRWVDSFSIHGILPYYLPAKYTQLVDAFKAKNFNNILRQAAEIGHYIADAHVPLHTTSNYNGQLTNQLGLHAFWESRIPELFADKDYDYLVGKASYIKDISTYGWDIVEHSHRLVDSVLLIEKRLSVSYPSDLQYCFDERLGVQVRIQCEPYAKAYQNAMKGMVEERMRDAILAVGSVWYSAWIDAGQPNLKKMIKSSPPIQKSKEDEDIDKAYKNNVILGRSEN